MNPKILTETNFVKSVVFFDTSEKTFINQ